MTLARLGEVLMKLPLGNQTDQLLINQLDYKGDIINSCYGIAEAFNDYFCSIALGLLVMIRSASSGCVVWGISSWSLWHWWLKFNWNWRQLYGLLTSDYQINKSKATGLDNVPAR